MKKNLLFTFILFVLSGFCVSAQVYHEDDKEVLRQFMMQPSIENGKLNFEYLGLDVSDTQNWYTSEDWVGKIKMNLRWVDDPSSIKRLGGIAFGLGFECASGHFDGRKLAYLKDVHLSQSFITSIDVSGTNIDFFYGEASYALRSIDISNCTKLRSLSFDFGTTLNNGVVECGGVLEDLKMTNCQNLNSLHLRWSSIERMDFPPSLTHLDLSENQFFRPDISPFPKNLESLAWEGGKLRYLDLSALDQLIYLSCSNHQLTDLNLPKSGRLHTVVCRNNQLTGIDLSNHVNLIQLQCSGNRLTNLDLSNLSQLYGLSCSYNQLTSLDLSNNSSLATADCAYNQLTKVNRFNNKRLWLLDCSNNQLAELDTSNMHPKLPIVICMNNNLRFSTFRVVGLGSATAYTPQAHIQGGDIMAGSNIDISSEYNIDGTITAYQWYDKSYAPITLPMKAGGVFVADAAYTGDSLTCEMKNVLFPELTLYYKVKVTEAGVSLADHLKFNNPDAEYTYSVAPERNFKVYAKTTVNPADVRLGLYNPSTASYKGDVTIVSRSNYTYTCYVPSSVSAAAYMIMPYIVKNGAKVPIERLSGSHIIDKLPIAVEEGDIWGLGSGMPTSDDINMTGYMLLKTNNLHAVKRETNFVVTSPASAVVNIGLFFLDGEFYTKISNAKSGNNYRCNIPADVVEGDYMILPYEESAGEIRIVERIANAKIMDRLPLRVEDAEDEWEEFSLKALSDRATGTEVHSVSVYPNPVSDMLYIDNMEVVKAIEIYDIKGLMVRQMTAGIESGLSVGELPAGIYILRATSHTGAIVTTKFRKR